MSQQVLTVSIAEFCRLTGLGRTSVFALVRSRAVDSVLIGRRRLILMASVEALLTSGRGEAD